MLLALSVGNLLSQNVLVTGALVGNGSYPTLGAAFAAINGGAQTGATVIVFITGNTTEPTTAVLNQGTWAYLGVAPQGGVARTISGSIAGPLIEFNSADRVGFDGLNTGGNSLTIENTNTGAASTLHFINDARGVGFQNLTILGASTSATMGTVFADIGTGTGGGNDSLAFNNVAISNSGANFPVNAFFSAGTVTAGQENSQVTFQSCAISNYFSATAASRGIFASTGNTDWTITGCKFFQTATRTYTTANTHAAIKIASGDNHLVTSNTIGYATVAGTGLYTMTSTVATRFIGIELTVGTTTASSVQGNTVKAISLGTSSGASTTFGILCGISITGGNANIGNLTPNTIGATAGVDQLLATPTTGGGTIVGIHCGSTGNVLIQGNLIGGFTSVGSTASVGGGVLGISVSAVGTVITISNNTIGNTTPDNMRAGSLGVTTGGSFAQGIFLGAMPNTVTISNNIVRNISSYGTGTAGYVRGISTLATTTALGTPTVTGNNVSNLTTTNSNATYASGLIGTAGIIIGAGGNPVINGNTVTNIRNNNAGAVGTVVSAFSHGSSTNATFSNNVVYGIGNASTTTSTTAPAVAAGFVIRSGTTGLTIFNNMISLGNGETTNTCFAGIIGNHGSTPDPTMKIYHNTINIEGTAAAGAQPSFGIARTDFTLTARTAPYDVRNNIITNTRTGGTGQHFAIANNYGATASATGWGLNASNNNILNANPATVGWWTTAQPFAGWKTAANSDAASFSGVTVTYVNSVTNLHMNFGTSANAVESNGQTIAAVTTDIDVQVRPGPVGSVNGGALAPDLGADEFDGVIGDFAVPNILYTPLNYTCLTTDRTITATISDFGGVPTAGILQPRIYFRKNLGTWFSNAGTLTSGSGTNGTWTFNITAATMGGVVLGDNIQYYIIAQDVASPTPNIGAIPSVGLVATDVNTVTTAPTNPNGYTIGGTLTGTYTVGAAGNYSTLTAAVNAYNSSCLSGPVTFSLIDATYPAETYPVTVGFNIDASALNTLTIKPATGVNAAFSGSSATAMINLSGADYVTIDGSNSTTLNTVCPRVTASRNLTITNTNASLSSFVVGITTANGTDAATNNGVTNCNLVGNSNTTTQGGVSISGPGLGLGNGSNGNNANKIINNSIQRTQFGIVSITTGAPKNVGNEFSLNSLDASGANALGRLGIVLLGEDAPVIHGNSIGNIVFTGSNDVMGISLGFGNITNSATAGLEVTNASVMYNVIDTLVENNTYSAIGIAVASAATGTTTIANNFVSNVFANGTGGDFACGIFSGGGVAPLKIYHNSITVTGATLTSATQPNMAIGINGVTPNVEILNNILVCSGNNGFAGNTGIGLGYTSTTGNYLNFLSNYNDISVSGSGSVIGRTGGLAAGTLRTTLLDWQTETGREANSLTIVPNFTSVSDLHLVFNTNFGLSNNGTPIVGIGSDVDCQSRSLTTPDIGADEWLPACSTAIAGTIMPGDTSACSADSLILFASTYSTGIGSSYVWESSPFGLNTWTVTGGTNPDNFPTGLVSSPTEYRLIVTCATNSSTATSDTLSFYVRDSLSPVAVCQNLSVTLGANGIYVLPAANVDNGSSDNCTAAPSLNFTLGQDTFSCADVGTNLIILSVADNASNIDTCSAVITVIPSPLSATISSPILSSGQNISCLGGNDGSATVVDSGGCPTATYLWSNGQTAATAVGLVSGTYSVTVTDASGQTTVQSITLSEPATAVSGTAVTTDESCVPGNDGTIDLTPAGGSPGYTFSWSNSASSEDLSGLGAGTYTVTVTDIAGCTSTASATVNTSTPPATPTITQNGNNLDCSATGVTYQWFLNGSQIPGATGASTPLTGSGSYTVTITDGNGCTATSVAFVYVGISSGNFDNALKVWPNPARGTAFLTLQGTDLTPCNLVITDLRGRILLEKVQVDLSGAYELNLNGFAAGTYLIETRQNEVRRTLRLVVE